MGEKITNLQAYKDLKQAQSDLSDLEEMNEEYFDQGIPRDGNIYDASNYFLYRHHEQSLRNNIQSAKNHLHKPT